jgi:hypothetical protein
MGCEQENATRQSRPRNQGDAICFGNPSQNEGFGEMTDIHLKLFTPLIEMEDQLDSATVVYDLAAHTEQPDEAQFWMTRYYWHLANAIGWASRE